jgi:rRNA maturation endonuclease Nob1
MAEKAKTTGPPNKAKCAACGKSVPKTKYKCETCMGKALNKAYSNPDRTRWELDGSVK